MNNVQIDLYNQLMNKLDRYIFLMELSVLLQDQGIVVRNFRCKCNDDFMRGIENVMNYINTAYTIKEFTSSFSKNDEVNCIQEDYYKQSNGWYRFTLEYRNCAVHSFALPRKYNPENGELDIIIDELVSKQKELYMNEENLDKRKRIRNRIKLLNMFKKSFTPIFPMSSFIKHSLPCILEMTIKMLHAEFSNVTKNAITELIELEKETNDVDVSRTIENFYVLVSKDLDPTESLFREIHDTYVNNNYCVFRHYDSTGWF